MALSKAKSLEQYMFGADRSEVNLTLTEREAWEFIAWYRTQLHDPSLYDREVRKAEALGDPWIVLTGMTISGFEVAPAVYEELQ